MQTINLLAQALSKNEWQISQVNGLPLVQSPLLNRYAEDLVHAFTTRDGGITPAPYEHFNLGRHVQDHLLKLDALHNREVLCAALGADHNFLKVPGQVHSGNVVAIANRDAMPDLAKVDGVATSAPGVPLLLHFADCVPVIIYEHKLRLLSIVHAGWRGTAQSIAANAVGLLVRDYGADLAAMVAAVGPAIGTCCYPTGEEVVEQLMLTVSTSGGDKFSLGNTAALVTRIPGPAGGEAQPRPDLKAINAMQLLLAGVSEIDVCSFCTACRPDIFYSHRQSGGITGRQGAIGMIGNNAAN